MKKILLFILFFCTSLNFAFAEFIDATKDNKQGASGVNSSFNNDLFSGGATYGINLALPAGPRGLSPSVGLNYNSSTSDKQSIVGYGWNFTTPSIFRSTKKGNNNLYKLDEYVISTSFSNNELIKIGDGIFAGKNNNDLTKYELKNNSWVVITPDGTKHYFGGTDDFSQINPENNLTFRWYLQKSEDLFGNKILYSYEKEGTNVYLKDIKYAFYQDKELYKITFDYLHKDFSTFDYSKGFKIENHRLLSKINLFVEDVLRKEFVINYEDTETVIPKLISFQEKAGNKVLPKQKFSYYKTGFGFNLLKEIDNGKGGLTKLEYKPSAQFKDTTVPFNIKVLYKIITEDKITGVTNQTLYEYFGGHYYYDSLNVFGREYTGFSKVNIIDNSGKITKQYFHQSDKDPNNIKDSKIGEYKDHISKKGKIYRTEVFDNKGNLYTSSVTKWLNKKILGRTFTLKGRVTNSTWNKEKEHLDTAEDFIYDEKGNLIQNIKYGFVKADTNTGNFSDIENDKYVINNKFTENLTKNLLGIKIESSVIDNSGAEISKNKILYDGLNYGQVAFGLPTENKVYFKDEGRYISSKTAYKKGLPIKITNPIGNSVTYKYDKYGLFRISEKNAKNFEVKYEFDYLAQKPNKITDINNIKTEVEIDSFGRITKNYKIAPTGEKILLSENRYYDKTLPNYIENISYSGEGDENNITSRVYLNGTGKEIQSKKSYKNGKYSTVNISYTKDEKKEFISYPKFRDSINYALPIEKEKGNKLFYDSLGREIKQENSNGTTYKKYNLNKITVVNAKGVKKDLINDAYGNLTKVNEYNAGDVYTSNYTYNSLNKLATFEDANGNIRNLEYDSLGRVKKLEDLHKKDDKTFGSVSYRYDDNSKLIYKITPDSGGVKYKYDEIERIISEETEGRQIFLHYDQGAYSKGLLTGLRYKDYSESYSYNYLGQKTGDRKNYKNDIYDFSYDFTPRGDLKGLIYPDTTKVRYTYDKGYLDKVFYKNKEILKKIDLNDSFNPEKLVYGNDLTVSDSFDYDYGYRLKSRKSNLGEKIYQNLSYKFDNVGNIKGVIDEADTPIKKQALYNYDDLNRLVSTNIIGADNTPIDLNYTYDSIGNILNKSNVGDYIYEDLGTNNPHAVTKAGTKEYKYDKNGNVISEKDKSGEITYDYNGKNELTSSSQGSKTTTFEYNGAGDRVLKKTFGDNFASEYKYINEIYEEQDITEEVMLPTGEVDDNGNPIKAKTKVVTGKKYKYIFAGKDKIATIEEENDKEKTIYHLKDHLSGAALDIDESGKILQASDYLPFGDERVLYRDENYKNNYLFTGKERDEETNLQYFEVRYYNSNIGRFHGMDKVFWELGQSKRAISFLADPQQLNAYSYTRNNPLIFVDPTGEVAEDVTDVFHEWMGNFKKYTSAFSNQTLKQIFYLNVSAPFGLYDVKRSWQNTKNDKFDFLDFDYNIDTDRDSWVSVHGQKMSLDKVGNFYVGYNGEQVGFSYQELIFMGDTVEKMKRGEVTADEIQDRRYYLIGHLYSKLESEDKRHNEGLLKIMFKRAEKGPEDRQNFKELHKEISDYEKNYKLKDD